MFATIENNAHKVTYLVKRYPDKTFLEIINLLAMPSIDINVAIWYAQEQGWVSDPDPETQKINFLKAPEQWNFGQMADHLRDTLMHAFQALGRNEKDLDEATFTGWCTGYPQHDVLIVTNLLIDERKLATYELTDPNDLKSTYTFYTLFENLENMWGRKYFKEEPTGEEVPETDEPTNNEGAEESEPKSEN